MGSKEGGGDSPFALSKLRKIAQQKVSWYSLFHIISCHVTKINWLV